MDRTKANEYARKFRESHRELLRKKQNKYYKENRERLRKKQREYYHKNKEKINSDPRMKKWHCEWIKRNPEHNRKYARNRRARKNGAEGSHTVKQIKQLRKASRGICPGEKRDPHFVGEEKLTVDHIIPLSKGGKNNIDNLVLCLLEENAKMANKPLVEKINYKISNIK